MHIILLKLQNHPEEWMAPPFTDEEVRESNLSESPKPSRMHSAWLEGRDLCAFSTGPHHFKKENEDSLFCFEDHKRECKEWPQTSRCAPLFPIRLHGHRQGPTAKENLPGGCPSPARRKLYSPSRCFPEEHVTYLQKYLTFASLSWAFRASERQLM